MSSLWIERREQSGILRNAFFAALVFEITLLTAIGWHEHWLAHPQANTGLDPSRFVEAEVFQLPKLKRLTVERAPVEKPSPEKAIAKTPRGGKPAPAANITQENKTTSGEIFPPNHGPIAVYSPPPVIPSYLQNQDLHAYVVIDFFVTALGAVTPRLVTSSGNEELDALALDSVKQWQFRPGEQDHKAVDSKVRLKILFDVH